MRELPDPEASFHTNDSGQWVEGKNGTDMFTRDQVLAIQKQAYEDGLRAVSDTPCADDFHNPWAESLENCINGDNYLRSGEYRNLIKELDDLYRMRAVLAMLTASQKEQQ